MTFEKIDNISAQERHADKLDKDFDALRSEVALMEEALEDDVSCIENFSHMTKDHLVDVIMFLENTVLAWVKPKNAFSKLKSVSWYHTFVQVINDYLWFDSSKVDGSRWANSQKDVAWAQRLLNISADGDPWAQYLSAVKRFLQNWWEIAASKLATKEITTVQSLNIKPVESLINSRRGEAYAPYLSIINNFAQILDQPSNVFLKLFMRESWSIASKYLENPEMLIYASRKSPLKTSYKLLDDESQFVPDRTPRRYRSDWKTRKLRTIRDHELTLKSHVADRYLNQFKSWVENYPWAVGISQINKVTRDFITRKLTRKKKYSDALRSFFWSQDISEIYRKRDDPTHQLLMGMIYYDYKLWNSSWDPVMAFVKYHTWSTNLTSKQVKKYARSNKWVLDAYNDKFNLTGDNKVKADTITVAQYLEWTKLFYFS